MFFPISTSREEVLGTRLARLDDTHGDKQPSLLYEVPASIQYPSQSAQPVFSRKQIHLVEISLKPSLEVSGNLFN